VHTFGDLGRVPQGALERELGTLAGRICALARGEDHREVTPDGRAGSISQERTFDVDLTEPDAVAEELLAQVEQVAHRLRRHGFRARTATVKIRFGDFRTISRAATLDDATDRTDLLWSSASRLFGRWAGSSFRPVRLIGYRASGLTGSGPQLQLFTEETDERRRTLDRVTDAIREKFGEEAIHRRPRS
jgi:DNA polymerase-4